ncbi:MAG TPA: rhomboid family intramembrane serine protease [Acidimicrobiales bacterium]|nr:rhomboid family intramembrane serine protease [Acidimicrobiales bacterium]
MIPLRDDNPTTRPPIITILVIAACAVVFLLVQPSGRTSIFGKQAESDTAFTVQHAAIPCEVAQGRPLHIDELRNTFQANDADACNAADHSPSGFPGKQVYLALVVSMFMHAGWLHIGGNMLFFWIFGNNIEDEMGHVLFLVFYFVGGIVASLGHVLADPSSTVPVVGASGAIAAVMGAYLVLFPKARVQSLIIIPPIVLFRRVAAWILLGVWFLTQFAVDPSSGVAWVAHVTGFAFGVVVGLLMRATTNRRRSPVPVYG